jgi:hypothetical protein
MDIVVVLPSAYQAAEIAAPRGTKGNEGDAHEDYQWSSSHYWDPINDETLH